MAPRGARACGAHVAVRTFYGHPEAVRRPEVVRLPYRSWCCPSRAWSNGIPQTSSRSSSATCCFRAHRVACARLTGRIRATQAGRRSAPWTCASSPTRPSHGCRHPGSRRARRLTGFGGRAAAGLPARTFGAGAAGQGAGPPGSGHEPDAPGRTRPGSSLPRASSRPCPSARGHPPSRPIGRDRPDASRSA